MAGTGAAGARCQDKLLLVAMATAEFILPPSLCQRRSGIIQSTFFKDHTSNKGVSCGVRDNCHYSHGFSFCSGFAVDYMHAACSGFVTATMLIWRMSNWDQGFYLGNHLDKANGKTKKSVSHVGYV